MLATPSDVLISVGQSEQSVTVTAEMMKLFGNISLLVVDRAETIIVTIGNQASGLTGLKIWINGLSAAVAERDRPQITPMGTANNVAMPNPSATVTSDVPIWSR